MTGRPNLTARQVTLRVACVAAAAVTSTVSSADAAECRRDPKSALKAPIARPHDVSYGVRRHPLLGRGQLHSGIDYRGSIGDEVRAAGAGEVTFTGRDGEFGNAVTVRHDGGVSTRYTQLARFLVAAGQCVSRGQIIGHLGTTGLTAEPHLHFEVHLDGTAVDPLLILDPEGQRPQ